MSREFYDFHGVGVSIESESEELQERLRKDFEYFRVTGAPTAPLVRIRSSLGPAMVEGFPEGKKGKRTRNATIFTSGPYRYCDYGGQAMARFEFRAEEALIRSPNLHRLHEVTYLAALSRVGKHLDLRGYHRLHAMAVAREGGLLLFSMRSGGGKSTLFLKLAECPGVEILSDDSPLIRVKGSEIEILPFLLRVGIDERNPLHDELKNRGALQAAETMERMRYGQKLLIPLQALPGVVAKSSRFHRIFLVGGRRDGRSAPSWGHWSSIRAFVYLFEAMVIGVGLPMMREYFIEDTPSDWLKLMKIAFSRSYCAFRTVFGSTRLMLRLGSEPAENARFAYDLFERGSIPSARADRK